MVKGCLVKTNQTIVVLGNSAVGAHVWLLDKPNHIYIFQEMRANLDLATANGDARLLHAAYECMSCAMP